MLFLMAMHQLDHFSSSKGISRSEVLSIAIEQNIPLKGPLSHCMAESPFDF